MRSLALVMLLAAGVGLGIWIGQRLLPVQYHGSGPESLAPAARAQYITHIAIAYGGDEPLSEAAARLAFLGAPATDPAGATLAALEWAIGAGRPLPELRALATLARRFGSDSPTLLPYLPAGANEPPP